MYLLFWQLSTSVPIGRQLPIKCCLLHSFWCSVLESTNVQCIYRMLEKRLSMTILRISKVLGNSLISMLVSGVIQVGLFLYGLNYSPIQCWLQQFRLLCWCIELSYVFVIRCTLWYCLCSQFSSGIIHTCISKQQWKPKVSCRFKPTISMFINGPKQIVKSLAGKLQGIQVQPL